MGSRIEPCGKPVVMGNRSEMLGLILLFVSCYKGYM